MNKSGIVDVYKMGQSNKYGEIYVIQLLDERVFTFVPGATLMEVQEIPVGTFETFKIGYSKLDDFIPYKEWKMDNFGLYWNWNGKPLDKYTNHIDYKE